MRIKTGNAAALMVTASLALGLGGCFSSGGSGSSNGGGDPSGDDGLDLSDVSLATTEGLAPFRPVSVDGLPDEASAEELHVR